MAAAAATTVYVGRIPLSIQDDMFQQLLRLAGEVVSWKRLPDSATQTLKAFGFCTYVNQEDALRAMRLLNGLELGGQQLLLKIDSKVQAQLDEWTSAETARSGADSVQRSRDDGDERAREAMRSLVAQISAVTVDATLSRMDLDAEHDRDERMKAARERRKQDKARDLERQLRDRERAWEAIEREFLQDRRRTLEQREAIVKDRERRSRDQQYWDTTYDSDAEDRYMRSRRHRERELERELRDDVADREVERREAERSAVVPRGRSTSRSGDGDSQPAKRVQLAFDKLEGDALFSHKLNFAALEPGERASRVKAWVAAQVREYLGQEEGELIEFVLSLLRKGLGAADVTAQLQAIFEADTAKFVAGLWRQVLTEHASS